MAFDNNRNRPPDDPRREAVLAEMKEQTRLLKEILGLFDEFAGAHLNAQFPFGKAADRWRRRG